MTTFDELKRAVQLVLALHDQEDEAAVPGFEGFRLDPKAEEQLRGAAEHADDSAPDLSGSITSVLHFLGNQKRRAIDGLFSGATEGYRAEWQDRDPFAFWCNLDLGNRRRLIELATDFYARAR
jgi:hypothetical protein